MGIVFLPVCIGISAEYLMAFFAPANQSPGFTACLRPHLFSKTLVYRGFLYSQGLKQSSDLLFRP